MKKILVLLCLICSMSASAETLKTDNPNLYLKNYVCGSDGYATFNAVNKTNKRWTAIKFHIYDSDGDPVDNFRWTLYVSANSGKKMKGGRFDNSCKKLKGVKYKVQTW